MKNNNVQVLVLTKRSSSASFPILLALERNIVSYFSTLIFMIPSILNVYKFSGSRKGGENLVSPLQVFVNVNVNGK